ncbi:MAG TPA: hypothetical protein VF658_06310 [Pyrinomonadaceae bacterium]|jgi:hypothetical protein
METDNLTEIYVDVQNKDYSSPVQARHLRGNLYQIVSEPPEDEQWEFTTGDRVRCMRRRFNDGKVQLLAYAKIEDENAVESSLTN